MQAHRKQALVNGVRLTLLVYKIMHRQHLFAHHG